MNARVRSTLSLLLAFTWGCAAQTGTNVRRDVEEMLRQAGDATVLQRGEVLVMRVDTLPVEPTGAFVTLEQVYATLGLDVDHREGEAGRIGGTTQRLGLVQGSPPSAWLDCGSSVNATAQADSYDVALTVASRVVPVEGGTALETVVRGKGSPRNVSGGTVICSSLGTLELRIANLVLRGARRTR